MTEFNPVEVQKHLQGADYPASGEGLASSAERNESFSGPPEVMAALKRL